MQNNIEEPAESYEPSYKHAPVSEHLEKVATNQTLSKVDILNKTAYKGDDSDGKIERTFQKLLAAAFLAMLYTGMLIHYGPSTGNL